MPRKARREPDRYRWDSVRLLQQGERSLRPRRPGDSPAGRCRESRRPRERRGRCRQTEREKCGSKEGGACRGRWAGQVRGLGVR